MPISSAAGDFLGSWWYLEASLVFVLREMLQPQL